MASFWTKKKTLSQDQKRGIATLFLGPAANVLDIDDEPTEARKFLDYLVDLPAFKYQVLETVEGGYPLPQNRMGQHALKASRQALEGLYEKSLSHQTWTQLLLAVLSSPKDFFGRSKLPGPAAHLHTMLEARHHSEQSAFAAQIQSVTRDRIRGFALNALSPDSSIECQLFVEGLFIQTFKADQYSGPLQDQFGGTGYFSFDEIIQLPPEFLERDWLTFELKDASSGAALLPSERHLLRLEARASAVHRLSLSLHAVSQKLAEKSATLGAEDLETLQQQLSAIQAQLPAVNDFGSIPISEYEDYRAIYSVTPDTVSKAPSPGCPITFISDAAQTECPLSKSLSALGFDPQVPLHTKLEIAPHSGWFLRLSKNAKLLGCPQVPENSSGKRVLTFDFEILESDGSLSPYFFAGFDYDRVVAHNPHGSVIALWLDEGESVPQSGEDWLATALQRYIEEGPSVFGHAPGPIITCTHEGVFGSMDQMQVTSGHLKKFIPDAKLEPHSDPVGGPIEGAVSIHWPQPADGQLSVIIPTRDRLDLLQNCVMSLFKHAATPEKLDVVIVDNGSVEQQTLAWLSTPPDGISLTVVRDDSPFNWAALSNLGRSAAKSDYLLFLNNDTEAIAPGFDHAFLSQLNRSNIGVVGARLLYPDGSLQHGGTCIAHNGVPHHEGVGDSPSDGLYLNRTRLPHASTAVTGAALAARADTFDAVGGFDAQAFPVAFNDTDFCMRVRKTGLEVLYEPAVIFLHRESISRGFDWNTPDKRARNLRERQIFLERWPNLASGDPMLPVHFAAQSPTYRFLTASKLRKYDNDCN